MTKKRPRQIGFVVTEEEKAAIEKRANQYGMTVSTFLRWLALGGDKTTN